MDRVSVVMPTYNARACIAATIDNLDAQTYPDIELIVVDDASSDDTVAVLRRKLQESFRHAWRIVELNRNHGPSGARNIGIVEASGTWVQFLDSDDFLARDKFQ